MARASYLVWHGARRRLWTGITWSHARTRFNQCVACGAGRIILTTAPRCTVTHVCAYRRTTCAAHSTVHVFRQLSHSLAISDLAVCCAHGEQARAIVDCSGCGDLHGRRTQKPPAQSLVNEWNGQVARGLVTEPATKQAHHEQKLQRMLEKGAQRPSYALILVDHDLWHFSRPASGAGCRPGHSHAHLQSWRSHCRRMWLMQRRSSIVRCVHRGKPACWPKS